MLSKKSNKCVFSRHNSSVLKEDSTDDTYGKRYTNHRLSFRHFLQRCFLDRAFPSLRVDIQSCIHIEETTYHLYHTIKQLSYFSYLLNNLTNLKFNLLKTTCVQLIHVCITPSNLNTSIKTNYYCSILFGRAFFIENTLF